MKKNTKVEEYYDFFQELPQAEMKMDYLKDIEIQDEYDSPDDAAGLSAEQVSELARDSLAASSHSSKEPPTSPSDKFKG